MKFRKVRNLQLSFVNVKNNINFVYKIINLLRFVTSTGTYASEMSLTFFSSKILGLERRLPRKFDVKKL